MSKPAAADTEPFAFRQELQETIFETIKGWEVRLPGKPLRGTTGGDAEAIAQAIREVYVGELRDSGSAGQHYLAMRGELVQAHNELDRVSIERSEEGAVHPLPHRVAILAGRYVDNQRRLAEIGAERATEGTPDGWQGQLPAEGTRRALIRDAIMSHRVFRTVGAETGEKTALELADLIEEALQRPSEPSDEYREDDRPKSLFTAGVEIEPNENSTLGLDEGTVGVVRGKRFCSRCGHWHYDVDFGEFGVHMLETNMRHARTESTDLADEAGGDDDPNGGTFQVRIGPDGYPWIGVLGLIGLLEKLGMAAYRDEEVAEPGPEPGEVEEFDPSLEVSRGLAHFRNVIRHMLGLDG